MSRIVISCYDYEDNLYCAGTKAAVADGIARSLSRKHEVVVISSSFPDSREEGTEPFRRIFLPIDSATPPQIGKLLFPIMLARAARRLKYDLWIESVSVIPPISLIPRVTSKPVLAFVHSGIARTKTRPYLTFSYFADRIRPTDYSRIITLSNSPDALISQQRSTGRVEIPPGIRIPDDLPAPGEGSHILFLGNIDVSNNGLDLLLAAIAKANLSLPMLIAGAGRPAEELALTHLLEKTSGPIARIGSVSGQVRQELLRECAFVVLPFRFPTSDLPVLEAMAWGKPVIHFDLPRLDWTAPEAAIRIPAFDVNSLATAIHGLATDFPRRVIMSRAARKVAEQYSWEHIGERCLSIVDGCIVPGTRLGLAER